MRTSERIHSLFDTAFLVVLFHYSKLKIPFENFPLEFKRQLCHKQLAVFQEKINSFLKALDDFEQCVINCGKILFKSCLMLSST